MAVLGFGVALAGCQTSNIKPIQETKPLASKTTQNFGLTPEEFRVAINQRMSIPDLRFLKPFEPFVIKNKYFSVGNITDGQGTLEGKVDDDGKLVLLRYRSRLVDDKSLLTTMSLTQLTAKILPPTGVSEQQKESWIEQVMEAAVASPDNFSQKEVQRHIIYSASTTANGALDVSYRILD